MSSSHVIGFPPGRGVVVVFRDETHPKRKAMGPLDSIDCCSCRTMATSTTPQQAKHTRALFDALYERLVLGKGSKGAHEVSNHETNAAVVVDARSRPRPSTSKPNTQDNVQPNARATWNATDVTTNEVHVDVSSHERRKKESTKWTEEVDVESSPNQVPSALQPSVDPSHVRNTSEKETRSTRRKRGTNPKTAERLDCCSICYQPFRRGVPWTKLPSCGHRFHVPCIQTWVEVQNTCPTCRVRITKVRKQHVPDRSLATLLPNAAYEALVCTACGSGADEGRLLLCDGCDRGWHIYCLVPPKPQLPSEEEAWFCETCANLQANTTPGGTGAPQHPPSTFQAPPEAQEAPPTQTRNEAPPRHPGPRKRTRGGGRDTGSRSSVREGASHPPVAGLPSEDTDLKVP